MASLKNRREIIDRAAVLEAAHETVDAAKNDAAAQRALLAVYKGALEQGRAVVRKAFRRRPERHGGGRRAVLPDGPDHPHHA